MSHNSHLNLSFLARKILILFDFFCICKISIPLSHPIIRNDVKVSNNTTTNKQVKYMCCELMYLSEHVLILIKRTSSQWPNEKQRKTISGLAVHQCGSGCLEHDPAVEYYITDLRINNNHQYKQKQD